MANLLTMSQTNRQALQCSEIFVLWSTIAWTKVYWGEILEAKAKIETQAKSETARLVTNKQHSLSH